MSQESPEGGASPVQPPDGEPERCKPDPRLFHESQALRNVQPRIQAAVAEGAFLAVQEAKGAGENDSMQAAILAAYARAWDNLRVVIERRVEDDVI